MESVSVRKVDAVDFVDIELEVPTSKSISNRLLILAAQSSSPVILRGLSDSTDVLRLIDCLRMCGVTLSRSGANTIIHGPFPQCEKRSHEVIELKTGDGGTTNRFLLPLLALGENHYRLITSEKMQARPNRPLFEALENLGASLILPQSGDDFWVEVKGSGGLKGQVTIDSSLSTQFASGLMLATWNSSVNVTIDKLSSSQAYLQLTINLIEEWKKGRRDFTIPVDSSSLSYPLALGAVKGRVLITNGLEIDATQADSILLELFKEWGITMTSTTSGLSIEKSTIPAFSFNGAGCPDLIPTLCYLAAFSQGKCELSGLEVLRHKESDRLEEVCRLLALFAVDHHLDSANHCLTIVGNPRRRSPHRIYYPPADHRMIMVGYLFMRSLSGGELHHCQHVAKSFPHFFSAIETDRAK